MSTFNYNDIVKFHSPNEQEICYGIVESSDDDAVMVIHRGGQGYTERIIVSDVWHFDPNDPSSTPTPHQFRYLPKSYDSDWSDREAYTPPPQVQESPPSLPHGGGGGNVVFSGIIPNVDRTSNWGQGGHSDAEDEPPQRLTQISNLSMFPPTQTEQDEEEDEDYRVEDTFSKHPQPTIYHAASKNLEVMNIVSGGSCKVMSAQEIETLVLEMSSQLPSPPGHVTVKVHKSTQDASLGIKFMRREDVLVIEKVLPDGLFCTNVDIQLEPGMTVTTINGENYSNCREGMHMMRNVVGTLSITASRPANPSPPPPPPFAAAAAASSAVPADASAADHNEACNRGRETALGQSPSGLSKYQALSNAIQSTIWVFDAKGGVRSRSIVTPTSMPRDEKSTHPLLLLGILGNEDTEDVARVDTDEILKPAAKKTKVEDSNEEGEEEDAEKCYLMYSKVSDCNQVLLEGKDPFFNDFSFWKDPSGGEIVSTDNVERKITVVCRENDTALKATRQDFPCVAGNMTRDFWDPNGIKISPRDSYTESEWQAARARNIEALGGVANDDNLVDSDMSQKMTVNDVNELLRKNGYYVPLKAFGKKQRGEHRKKACDGTFSITSVVKPIYDSIQQLMLKAMARLCTTNLGGVQTFNPCGTDLYNLFDERGRALHNLVDMKNTKGSGGLYHSARESILNGTNWPFTRAYPDTLQPYPVGPRWWPTTQTWRQSLPAHHQLHADFTEGRHALCPPCLFPDGYKPAPINAHLPQEDWQKTDTWCHIHPIRSMFFHLFHGQPRYYNYGALGAPYGDSFDTYMLHPKDTADVVNVNSWNQWMTDMGSSHLPMPVYAAWHVKFNDLANPSLVNVTIIKYFHNYNFCPPHIVNLADVN